MAEVVGIRLRHGSRHFRGNGRNLGCAVCGEQLCGDGSRSAGKDKVELWHARCRGEAVRIGPWFKGKGDESLQARYLRVNERKDALARNFNLAIVKTLVDNRQRGTKRIKTATDKRPGFFKFSEVRRQCPERRDGLGNYGEEKQTSGLAVEVHHDGQLDDIALNLERRAVGDIDLAAAQYVKKPEEVDFPQGHVGVKARLVHVLKNVKHKFVGLG